jgi:hypothetical protein
MHLLGLLILGPSFSLDNNDRKPSSKSKIFEFFLNVLFFVLDNLFTLAKAYQNSQPTTEEREKLSKVCHVFFCKS